jgi:hypothetical protein
MYYFLKFSFIPICSYNLKSYKCSKNSINANEIIITDVRIRFSDIFKARFPGVDTIMHWINNGLIMEKKDQKAKELVIT